MSARTVSEADERALKGPREGIPDDLVRSAAAEAFDHWPDPAGLYRWLTPRIMALMVQDQLWVDEALIAWKLEAAGAPMWLPDLHAGSLEVGWIGGREIAEQLTPWLLQNGPARLARLGDPASKQQQGLEELARRTSEAM